MHDLAEGEDVVDTLFEVSLGDSVEVLAELNFVFCKLSELRVGEADVHFVVDIGPLGSEVVGRAVASVTGDEVGGFSEISELKLFLEGTFLAETP